MDKHDEKGNYNRFQWCIHWLGVGYLNLALKTHFKIFSKNTSYKSPIIGNEINSTCGDNILKEIFCKINEIKCISMLADVTSNISDIK